MSTDQIKRIILGVALCLALGIIVTDWTLIGRIASVRAADADCEVDSDCWFVSSRKPSLLFAPGLNTQQTAGGDKAANLQEKTAEEVYKNIQIFKGVPASRIMGAMQFFSRSLG